MGAVTSVFGQVFLDVFLGRAEMALAPDHVEERGGLVGRIAQVVFHGNNGDALLFVQLVD